MVEAQKRLAPRGGGPSSGTGTPSPTTYRGYPSTPALYTLGSNISRDSTRPERVRRAKNLEGRTLQVGTGDRQAREHHTYVASHRPPILGTRAIKSFNPTRGLCTRRTIWGSGQRAVGRLPRGYIRSTPSTSSIIKLLVPLSSLTPFLVVANALGYGAHVVDPGAPPSTLRMADVHHGAFDIEPPCSSSSSPSHALTLALCRHAHYVLDATRSTAHDGRKNMYRLVSVAS